MMTRLNAVVMLVVLTGLLPGCGGVERPATIPVSGAVLYNGQPVAGVTVSFWGPDAARAAQGVTDAEGKFTLSMFSVNDGALAGENVVTVVKDKVASGTQAVSPTDMLNDPSKLTANYNATQEAEDGDEKPAIPAKYATPSTSPLKVTVADSEAGRNHVLQLAD